MANEYDAKFQEVINLTVDVPGFTKTLQEAGEEWDKFKKKFGDNGLAGLTAGTSAELKKLADDLKSMQELIVNSQAQIVETLEQLNAKEVTDTKAKNDKKVKNAKDTAAAELEINKDLEKAKAELLKQAEKVPKFTRDLNTEREGSVATDADAVAKQVKAAAALDQARLAAARDISDTIEGINNAYEELQEKHAAKQAALDARKEAAALKRLGSQEQIARQFAVEQEGIDNAYIAAQEKLAAKQEALNAKKETTDLARLKSQETLARSFAIEQEGIEDAHVARLEKQLNRVLTLHEKEAALDKLRADRQLKSAQGIAVEQEGVENKALETRLALEQQIAAVQKQTAATVNKDRLAGLPKAEQLKELATLYKQVQQEVAKLTLELKTLGGTNSVEGDQERLRISRAIDKLTQDGVGYKKQALSLEGGSNIEAGKQVGFLAKITGGLEGTTAHLLRFYAISQVLTITFQTLAAVITAPFKAIADGLSYLRETERSADDLVGLLASTTKFSDDFATNFQKAKEASIEVTRELQKVAAVTGFGADVIERIFKVFQGSGALKYVSTLQDVVKLTEMFAITLKGAGNVGLDAATAIQQINELLNGTVKNSEPFLAKMSINVQQWEKIKKDSEQHRNLVQLLAGAYKPFSEQVIAAGQGQQVLINSLTIMGKQLEGIAAKGLFEEINKGLNALVGYLAENGPIIASWLKVVADQIIALSLLLIDLAKHTPVFDLMVLGLKAVATYAFLVSESFVETTNALLALYNVAKSGGGLLDPKGFADALILQKKNVEEARKRAQEFRDVLTGKPTVSPDTNNLSQTVGNAGDNNRSTKTNFGEIRANLGLEKAKLDKEIGDIERKYAELNDKIQEALSARTLTFKEAAQQSAANAAAEIAELTITNDKKISLIKRAAAAAAAEGDKDPKKAAIERINLEKELYQNAESFADKTRGLQRQVVAANKRAIEETVALQKLGSEQKRRLIEEAAQAELSLTKELGKQGFLTELDVFEKENELDNLRVQQQIERLQEESDRYKDGTAEKTKLLNEMELVEVKHFNGEAERGKKRLAIIEKERVAREKLLIDARALQIAEEQQNLDNLSSTTPGLSLFDAVEKLYDKKRDLLGVQIDLAQSQLQEAINTKKSADEIQRLTNAVTELYTARQALLGQRLNNVTQSIANPILAQIVRNQDARAGATTVAAPKVQAKDAVNAVFGSGLFEGVQRAFGPAGTAMEKFGAVVAVASSGLAVLGNVLGAFKQGKESGGILGGIGAVGAQFSNLPIVGPYIAAISGALSFIGQLFTNAAKKIAEDIKKSFQKILDNYSAGNITLVDTIAQLESARVEAISRLSGKKGGKTELDKLLPDIEKEIASLKRQQKELITTFESQLDGLLLQNDALAQVKQQWADINKQVRDYLNAGGDATKAAQFLSLSLDKIRQQTVEELESAEKDAIQSMLKLNDLLKQRNQLTDDFKKKEFDLINGSAIERRLPGSVSRGKELEALRKEYKDKLDNIDAEISGTQKVVDRQREVFNLANDTAELKRRDEALSLLSLDRQIEKIKTMKDLVAGMFTGPGGFTIGTGVLGPIQINVTVGGGYTSPTDIGQEIGQNISAELNRRLRMSPA